MSRKILCLVIILTLVLSIGCGLFKRQQPQEEIIEPEEDSEQTLTHLRKTVFYFVTEHDLLVPVTRDIPWVEGIGRAALGSLVDSNELRVELAEKGLRASLPEGTEILGMTISDGSAKVDFNSNFLNSADKIAEQNAINSVVYTLTEFPTVDQVQIFVEGKQIGQTSHGSTVKGNLQREKINLEDVVTTSAEMVR